MTELRECPFCGGDAGIEIMDLPLGHGYYVACYKCDGQMGDTDDTYRSPAIVAEMWNRRAPLPDDVIKDILFLCYNGLEHPAAGRVMRWLDAPPASG